MNEQEKEKGLRDAATRAAAVLRSVAQDQANEQSRRKVLLHTLLDAVLCVGEMAPTLTVLGGTAYLTLSGDVKLPGNGARSAKDLAELLLAFCQAAGMSVCPHDS